jgi:hypothetical protein
LPWRAIQAARQVSSRAASTAAACRPAEGDALVLPIGLPNCTRSARTRAANSYGGAGDADRHRGDRRAGRLEGLHRRLLAAAAALADPGQPAVELLLAADQAAAGHPDVVEDDLGGVRGPDAVLLELLPLDRPLCRAAR